MSKVTKIAEAVVELPIQTMDELTYLAKKANLSKSKISKETVETIEEGNARFNEALSRFEKVGKDLILKEVELSKTTKTVTGKIKDSINQVHTAMGRLDLKDFEVKLLLLERFVKALEALDELNKSGNLINLVKAISNK